MPDLIYPGPYDEVEVPEFGITATADEPVAVPDIAVERLQAQGWREPAKAESKQPASNGGKPKQKENA